MTDRIWVPVYDAYAMSAQSGARYMALVDVQEVLHALGQDWRKMANERLAERQRVNGQPFKSSAGASTVLVTAEGSAPAEPLAADHPTPRDT